MKKSVANSLDNWLKTYTPNLSVSDADSCEPNVSYKLFCFNFDYFIRGLAYEIQMLVYQYFLLEIYISISLLTISPKPAKETFIDAPSYVKGWLKPRVIFYNHKHGVNRGEKKLKLHTGIKELLWSHH